MDDALNIGAFNVQMMRLSYCLPPIKNSGYAPAWPWSGICFPNRSTTQSKKPNTFP